MDQIPAARSVRHSQRRWEAVVSRIILDTFRVAEAARSAAAAPSGEATPSDEAFPF